MRDKTRSFGEPTHFIYQSRFTNSRFTTDIHDLTIAARQARGNQAFELIELGFAPNKGSPVGQWRFG